MPALAVLLLIHDLYHGPQSFIAVSWLDLEFLAKPDASHPPSISSHLGLGPRLQETLSVCLLNDR